MKERTGAEDLVVEKRKILVADDARINRGTLKAIYDSEYEIMEAEDGEQAIARLEEYGEAIDLFLLDLRMPKKDGFEVLDDMRRKRLLDQIPVIIITASADQEDELRAFNSGADEVIRKPFVPEIVLRRSENLINLYSSRKLLAKQLVASRVELTGIQNRDALTGLLNMKAFFDAANTMLKECDWEKGESYRFVYSNITNFKFYNVMNGLDSGDRILRILADYLTSISPNLLCARFGQDHFVVMTRDDNSRIRENVRRVAEAFQASFGQYGMQHKAGFYCVRDKEHKAEAACEFAKLACDAIRHSTEQCCEYTEELGRKVEIETYVIQHIDEAVQNHYIEVYYQPVVRTLTGKTCGMEALSRWKDPEKGFLSPADFIPSLEKNHLITKLDLYVLRETCRGMRQLKVMGKPLLPVSFNFSRVDFLACDLLKEINEIAAEYNISRDLICVEITETAIMKDPERMKQEILRFRAEGYQVWMDDFGSGYSSLNVLKDYQFDEIKLDMKFMTSFDERSKQIVTAIIAMAKQLGIQTLAEGVENQEQYDFLQSIGCEKVQGYFYSRPLPVNELIHIPQTMPSRIEQRAWRNYYDRISASDFITSKAQAIFEYDGSEYHFLYRNKAYEEVLLSTDVADMQMVMENINSPVSSFHRIYNELRERCLPGGPEQSVVYSIRDHYVRLYVRCIAEHKNRSAFEVEMINLSGSESEKMRTKMDKVGRQLFGMFDVIFRGDLATGEAELIRQGEYGYDVHPEVLNTLHTIDEMNQTLVRQIHPADREAFLLFADHTTLKTRINQEEYSYITEYFRIRQRNGGYVWKAFRIMYLTDFNTAIYTFCYVPIAEEHIWKRTIPEHLHLNVQEDILDESQRWMLKSVLDSTSQNLFWKDTDRRFVGANRAFLDTYGFQDVSEILGKTDEDMGWHIADGPFMSDEEEVLKKGITVVRRPGTCNIRGVSRNILATKEPVYEKGKIVGLFGNFLDADTIKESHAQLGMMEISDKVTGLMSSRSLVNTMAKYVEEWKNHRQNFASISILIPGYTDAVRDFGDATVGRMLREIGHIITERVGVRGTCARLYSGNFVILMRYTDKKIINALAGDIRRDLESIHSLAGRAVTVYPQIDISFSDEADNVHAMLGFIAECAIADIVEQDR